MVACRLETPQTHQTHPILLQEIPSLSGHNETIVSREQQLVARFTLRPSTLFLTHMSQNIDILFMSRALIGAKQLDLMAKELDENFMFN